MGNTTEEVVDEFVMSISLFDFSDYFVFFLVILLSVLIGIYFGCFGSKQSTTEEYLLGGKTMKPIPVGLSLVASHISGITLIGTPSEVYAEGSTYIFLCLSLLFVGIALLVFYVPVIRGLNIDTIFEYLELRFNKVAKAYGSVLFIIGYGAFLPCVIYVPCLALAQVTGINLYIISIGITAICMFYTIIGGIKAVIWTDFLQTIIMIFACFAILIIGTHRVGGFSYVWDIAKDNGKLFVSYDTNPFQRNTFWTVTIGLFVSWFLGEISSQGMVQRLIAVPSKFDTFIVIITFVGGVALLTAMSVYGGLLAYAAYFGCDPIERHIIEKQDQIYPYYVLDKIGDIPALPGLFIAGIFSAALSSLSAGFNTLAGVIYQDIIKRNKSIDENGNFTMKIIIVVLGIIFMFAIIVLEKMKGILELTYKISSITGAPLGSMILLGMFVPYVNAKGALIGSVTSMISIIWIVVGSSLHSINQPHNSIYPNIESTCPEYDKFHNITLSHEDTLKVYRDDRFILYRIPFTYYITFGLLVSTVVSLIATYFTGGNDLKKMDPKLISPFMRRYLPKETEETDNQVKLNLITNKINV